MEPKTQYRGPERRQSQSQYHGDERRKAEPMVSGGPAGVSAQEATGQQPGDAKRAYDDTQ